MKKINFYYLFIFILLIVIVFLFKLLFSTANNDSKTEKISIPISYEKDKTTGKIVNVTLNPPKKNILQKDKNKSKTFKEIFKEPEDIPLNEKLEAEDELSKLNTESKNIIDETEAFIKEKGIEPLSPKLTKEQENELQKYDEKLNKLKKKVEELSRDK